jgi:predicted dienelactone hydrolase
MLRVLLLSLLGGILVLSATPAASIPPVLAWGVPRISAQLAPPDPATPGPYAVGVTRRTFSRVSTTTGEPRVLDTVIWYPAAAAAAALPADETLAAPTDAVPEWAGAPYPVLLYSHGNTAQPWTSSFFTTHLASYGFVVMAPAHAGNTPDSCPQPCTDSNPIFLEARFDSAANRPADISFVLSEALALNTTSDATLRGLLDGQRVGITGYSFGASTTLAMLAQDPRFLAGVALAPATAPPGAQLAGPAAPQVAAPLLILGGMRDDLASFPQQQVYFAAIPATAPEHVLVALPRDGHFAFFDRCPPARAGCGPDDLPHAQGHVLINRWATAFLLRYVAGDEGQASAWDAVLAQTDPEVQVTIISGP